MARSSNFTTVFDISLTAERVGNEIRIMSGDHWTTVSREESIQFEADLHAINTQAAPVDAEVAA